VTIHIPSKSSRMMQDVQTSYNLRKSKFITLVENSLSSGGSIIAHLMLIYHFKTFLLMHQLIPKFWYIY